MKKVHYAGIPCKANDAGGNSYSHVESLVTCKECKDIKSGVVDLKKASNDKRAVKKTIK